MWFDFTTLRMAGTRISTFAVDLAKGRRAILNLGCGTGVLAAALARKPDWLVVGVDPAAAMLALAKQQCGGASVSWVLDDARPARLNRRFDLVLLAGHAFQVFPTPDNRTAALTTIRLRLRGPNGARDEFHLAATAQNLRKLAELIPMRSPIAATWGEVTLTSKAATPDPPRRDYFKPDFFVYIGQLPPNAIYADILRGGSSSSGNGQT
jgi:SAM-dependent methyltransferase